MITKIIDGRVCFIGRGEDLTLGILQHLFPVNFFYQQVPLSRLVNHKIEELSSRQMKETIDIVMMDRDAYFAKQRAHTNIVAVRVQNFKGPGRSRAEELQKAILLRNPRIKVADVSEHECPNVFREKWNYMAVFEVCDALRRAGVKP